MEISEVDTEKWRRRYEIFIGSMAFCSLIWFLGWLPVAWDLAHFPVTFATGLYYMYLMTLPVVVVSSLTAGVGYRVRNRSIFIAGSTFPWIYLGVFIIGFIGVNLLSTPVY